MRRLDVSESSRINFNERNVGFEVRGDRNVLRGWDFRLIGVSLLEADA